MNILPSTPPSGAGSPYRRSQREPYTPSHQSSPQSPSSSRWRNSVNYTPRSPSHLRQSTLSPEPESVHSSENTQELEPRPRSTGPRGAAVTPKRLTQAEMVNTPPPLFGLGKGTSPSTSMGSNNAPSASCSVGGLGQDPLAKLHPAQLRELRESFEVLDADGDGFVDSADVKAMLEQLGLDQSYSSLSKYFTPTTTRFALPAYLSMLANLLAPISAPQELLAAFSAFDDDDSGQIDIATLREAMRMCGNGTDRTNFDAIIADFTGRRAFGLNNTAGGNGGDVFRYREFVDLVGGGAAAARERAGAVAGSNQNVGMQQMPEVAA